MIKFFSFWKKLLSIGFHVVSLLFINKTSTFVLFISMKMWKCYAKLILHRNIKYTSDIKWYIEF